MKPPSESVKVSSDELNGGNSGKPLDFEKILKNEIGEFGPYQILVAVTTGIFAAYGSFVIFNFVYGAAIPDHRYSKFDISLHFSLN